MGLQVLTGGTNFIPSYWQTSIYLVGMMFIISGFISVKVWNGSFSFLSASDVGLPYSLF